MQPLELYPFQRTWLTDQSRFSMWLACRQFAGKSTTTTLYAVADSLRRTTDWVYLSVGERQAKELADKAKEHLERLESVAKGMSIDTDDFIGEDKRYTQTRIVLPNKSRHIFLPANPDTARGYSGNIHLDEFAFHRDSAKVWGALYPTISRKRDYQLRITTTPNGKTGKFWELWEGKTERILGKSVWTRHRTDIYQAVEQINRLSDPDEHIDLEELRAGLSDDLLWQQEYELEFLDAAFALLPYELIESCEDWSVSMTLNLDAIKNGFYLGMDIGRRGHPSVIWLLEPEQGVLFTRGVIEMPSTSFSEQEARLFPLLAHPECRGAAIDETGLGMQMTERAIERFPHKVRGVMFSQKSKLELATGIRKAFEDKALRIPIDLKVRADLHSVQQQTLPSGATRYEAEDSGNRHGDYFWALSLAHYASRQAPPPNYAEESHYQPSRHQYR